MAQKEASIIKRRKGGIQMALLAAPIKTAFRIDAKDAKILTQKTDAVLNAFRKVRKAEAESGDTVRLEQLDAQIRILQEECDSGK